MSDQPASYQCPKCGAVSHNPNDIIHSYCGRCHVFEGDGARNVRADPAAADREYPDPTAYAAKLAERFKHRPPE